MRARILKLLRHREQVSQPELLAVVGERASTRSHKQPSLKSSRIRAEAPSFRRTRPQDSSFTAWHTMSVIMRTARMNLRLAEEADDRIRRAAAVSGVSTSAFVERAASVAADTVLADRREFVLDSLDWDRFVAELDRPAEDLPELRRGRELRDRLIAP
jgi:uncharacterized protein (DUF1778 family)